MNPEPIYLEGGARRTFAGAIEWPGWCRSAGSAEEAVVALVAYAPRYAAAVAVSGLLFEPPVDVAALHVAERLVGDSGTEFGVPSQAPEADQRGLDPAALERQVALLEAAWSTFDGVAARAVGHALRLGPRGGGRDLDRIIEHVREADAGYLAQLGARAPRQQGIPGQTDWEALRARAVQTLRARTIGAPVVEADRVKRPWTPRYHVRRATWHLLDHAWEIEDRMLP